MKYLKYVLLLIVGIFGISFSNADSISFNGSCSDFGVDCYVSSFFSDPLYFSGGYWLLSCETDSPFSAPDQSFSINYGSVDNCNDGCYSFGVNAFSENSVSHYSLNFVDHPIYFLGYDFSFFTWFHPFLGNFDCIITTFGYGNPFSGSSIPTPQNIKVFYDNNNQYEEFSCNGDENIFINSDGSFDNFIFTPTYSINYTDEDGQVLTENYSKNMLYLDGKYNKTYTGGVDNFWVFNPINGGFSNFTGYLPSFDITGSVSTPVTSGNVFNDFADNSLKVLLSNIPNYIQYVIIIALLFFVLGIVKKFKK